MSKQDYYLQHILQAEQQKLSLAEYARQHELPVHSLYAARYNAPEVRPETPSTFVPVQLSGVTNVRIVLPNGVTLHVTEVTASLVQYLAALPCSV